MEKLWSRQRRLSAAERGRLVQRVLVDGWSHSETAAAFGLPRRLVDAWVADYRRRGMASLRARPRRIAAAKTALMDLLHRLRMAMHPLLGALLQIAARQHPGPPSPGRRFDHDGSAGRT